MADNVGGPGGPGNGPGNGPEGIGMGRRRIISGIRQRLGKVGSEAAKAQNGTPKEKGKKWKKFKNFAKDKWDNRKGTCYAPK